jgi:uncharacterized protein DUF6228
MTNNSDSALTVRIGGEPAALVIEAPTVNDEGSAHSFVRLDGEGALARGEMELEGWSGGFQALTAYFRELAEAWRGWSGTKEWRDDGGTLSLSASHDGVGLITLRVTLSSLPYDVAGGWQLRLDVPLEPGSIDEMVAALERLDQSASSDIREQ